MERQGLQAALLLALLVTALVAGALPRGEGATARGALVGATGLGSPALAGGRELTDGLLGPLTEVPAGPSVHPLADAVAPPAPRVYTLRVFR